MDEGEIVHIIHSMTSMPSTQVSPKQLAQATGVSESSIKRWADEGRLTMTRTAGGHRRIAIHDAIHFIREAGMEVVNPDAIGLTNLEPVQAGSHTDRSERIRDLLIRGESEDFRAALIGAYVDGESLEQLCDGPLRWGMERAGQLWLESERGIFEEHRATALAVTGLIQLGLLLDSQVGQPIALGGAISGDTSQLPSLMASFVLKSAGFQTVNLGSTTPASSFREAISTYQPKLIWLCANHVEDSTTALQEIDTIVSCAREAGIPVVLGGRGVAELDRHARTGLETIRSMAELAAFGKGILRSHER